LVAPWAAAISGSTEEELDTAELDSAELEAAREELAAAEEETTLEEATVPEQPANGKTRVPRAMTVIAMLFFIKTLLSLIYFYELKTRSELWQSAN
jgi:hypothetical protein